MLARLAWLFVCLVIAAARTASATDLVLDRASVVELARAHAPAVQIAEARIGETRALRIGAGAPNALNPEVGVAAGPRFLSSGTIIDVVGSLAIPIDVSGSPGVRTQVADLRIQSAEAEAADVGRLAVGEAVDAWLLALGAEERLGLEKERAGLDETLYASARARRQAGTIGDLDLQLTAVLRADGESRLRRAEGDRDAALVLLKVRLGLPQSSEVHFEGRLDVTPPPPLAELLARLPERADYVRASAAIAVADEDARLQGRLGVPAPRLTASGGRDGELFGRVGLDVPLPFYQRNQTSRAVAEARKVTASTERVQVGATAEAEVRAAYATWSAASRAYEVLRGAAPSVSDAEHLATRAYELGQTTLPTLVVARRETTAANVARLDAHLALARARLALDVAAGVSP